MRISNPINPLIMLIMVQALFVFSCSGDSEVQLGHVVKLPEDSSSSVVVPSSSSIKSSNSSIEASSSSTESSSSSLEVSSSSSEEVSSSSLEASSSSSEEVSSSSLEVSSSSSEEVSSSSTVACVDGAGSPVTHGGQAYQTVKIGCQTWMAENLNYDASGSECYDEEPANCSIYGRLYSWAAATSAGTCPAGWHLPSDADWDILIGYVQTQNGENYNPAVNASVAGSHLKAKAADGWNGNDTYGFKALPGGSYTTSFVNIEFASVWWSSTESGDNAWRRSVSNSNTVIRGNNPKTNLYSVRCVQSN